MSQDELAVSEKKSLVSEVVMYLLSREVSKVPAKRIAIVKTIFPRHSKCFKSIMLDVKDVLSSVFGYKLMESDGRYFLINNFQPTELGLKILREPESHRIRCSLLILVLSLIFMEGRAVKDDDVLDFLRRLKIQVDDGPDPHFGVVRKLLTKDFVHMLYLEHTRREATDPPIFEFSSGPRANAEISKRTLLQFVCKMYGNEEQDWPEKLKQIEEMENSEAQRGFITNEMHFTQSQASHASTSQLSSSQPSSSQPSTSRFKRPSKSRH